MSLAHGLSRPLAAAAALAATLALMPGLGSPTSPAGAGESREVSFRDLTRRSGVRFTHRYDLKNGKMIATQGGGAALADYDGDGRLDLYCVNSVRAYGRSNDEHCGVLYRNQGPGSDGVVRFKDVTADSGIVACGWGQGAYWVDIDGDGDPDLFLTNAGRNQLFLNRGDGAEPRFEDISVASGLGATEGFHIGAAFLDADGDGDVDVYVVDYVNTEVELEEAYSGLDLKTPDDYAADENHFFLNLGNNRFVERTQQAGLADPGGKGLGAAAYDFNGDGWTDLYVANDRTPNALFLNDGSGSFRDVAVENGCAFDENGIALSGMGIAVGDFDGDGLADIFVTNYAPEWNTLYRGVGQGRFEDATGRSGLGPPSLERVGWGTGAIDYDNDGNLDLYVTNGNIMPFWLIRLAGFFGPSREKAKRFLVGESYQQPPMLFRGRGDGTFENTTHESGALGRLRMVGRGSAAGDVDGDGDTDLFLVNTSGFAWSRRRSRLLINEGGNRNAAIAILPRSADDRRTVLGARLVLESRGSRQTREWQIQPAYASGSATPLWFGLGSSDTKVERLTVFWPDGRSTIHENLPSGAVWSIRPDGTAVILSRFAAP